MKVHVPMAMTPVTLDLEEGGDDDVVLARW